MIAVAFFFCIFRHIQTNAELSIKVDLLKIQLQNYILT